MWETQNRSLKEKRKEEEKKGKRVKKGEKGKFLGEKIRECEIEKKSL